MVDRGKRQIWSANIPFKSSAISVASKGSACRRELRYISEGLIVSAIVQIWMLPLSVVYFHSVSISSVFLNLWVGFLSPSKAYRQYVGVIRGKGEHLTGSGFYATAEAMNWLCSSATGSFRTMAGRAFRLPAYSGKGTVIYVIYLFPVLFFAVGLAVRIWWLLLVGEIRRAKCFHRRLFVSACSRS